MLKYAKLCKNMTLGRNMYIKKHTFATICAENGINENTIAKWLGHGNPSTTKKYYIDVLSDFEKEQASKINSIFNT